MSGVECDSFAALIFPRMARLIIPLLLFLLIDLLVFKGVWLLTRGMGKPTRLWISIAYWAISLTAVIGFAVTMSNFRELRTHNPGLINFWLGVFFTLLVPKIIFIAFNLTDDIVHLVRLGWYKLFPGGAVDGSEGSGISRADFLTKAGLAASTVTLGAFVHGVTVGKYKFRVLEREIASDRIGYGLDGLRIVQISDMHLGSFAGDTAPVQKAVDMINSLNPDYILFTGDMVNEVADEAEPFIEVLGGLRAKHGKYSVFGNHDYAHYGEFTEEEEAASVKRLKEIHGEMGFRLLEDEHEVLTHGEDSFELLGVHNWGRGFFQKGDLGKAMKGSNPNRFQILMSHDPTHFEELVVDKTAIDLTLSGHTHGLQMGIEIPAIGLKFSPVQFVYKRWAGLYNVGKQMLYVNRGFGFLAFPGRVGIFPEITLFTLKSDRA